MRIILAIYLAVALLMTSWTLWSQAAHAIRCREHRRAVLRSMFVVAFLDFIWPITLCAVVYRMWWMVTALRRIVPVIREDRNPSMREWQDIKRFHAALRDPNLRAGFEMTAKSKWRERLYEFFAELEEREAPTAPGVEP